MSAKIKITITTADGTVLEQKMVWHREIESEMELVNEIMDVVSNRYETFDEADYSEKKREEWIKHAVANIEAHAGDVCSEEMSDDEITEEFTTLAFDALIDEECPPDIIDELVEAAVKRVKGEDEQPTRMVKLDELKPSDA